MNAEAGRVSQARNMKRSIELLPISLDSGFASNTATFQWEEMSDVRSLRLRDLDAEGQADMQADNSRRRQDSANRERNAVRLPSAEWSQAVSLDVTSRSIRAVASVGSLERASSNKSAQHTDKRFAFLFGCIGNLGGCTGVDGCMLAPKKGVSETRSRSFGDEPQNLGRTGTPGNLPASWEIFSCLLRVNNFSPALRNSPPRVMQRTRILRKQHASGYGS